MLARTVGHGVVMSPCPTQPHRPCPLRYGNEAASRRRNEGRSMTLLDMMQTIKKRKTIQCVFSLEHMNRITTQAKCKFFCWVTPLLIEMNVDISHLFHKPCKYQHFVFEPQKILISNSSPLHGRRVNRLPCFWVSLWLACLFQYCSPKWMHRGYLMQTETDVFFFGDLIGLVYRQHHWVSWFPQSIETLKRLAESHISRR